MKTKLINKYVGIIIILVAVVATGTLLFFTYNREAANANNKSIKNEASSQGDFSFVSSASTKGWWQGATNKTSMAVFYKPNNCFVSINYSNTPIEPDTELQGHLDMMKKQGYKVDSLGNKKLLLSINSDNFKYNLYQYHVTGTGAGGKIYAGEEFAYISLAKGHLKIQGYCDTVDQLSFTIPALQAIRFKH